MTIVSIIKSPRKGKRYRVTLKDGRHFDFGLTDGSTYIDHHDITKRKNYRARHIGNEKERNLIKREKLIKENDLITSILIIK